MTGRSSEVQAGAQSPLWGCCARRCCCRTGRGVRELSSLPAAAREVQVRKRSPVGDPGGGARASPRGDGERSHRPPRPGRGRTARSGSPPGSSRGTRVPAEAAGVCPGITPRCERPGRPSSRGGSAGPRPERRETGWRARAPRRAAQTGSAPGRGRGAEECKEEEGAGARRTEGGR